MLEKITSVFTNILKAMFGLILFSWCFAVLFAAGLISGLFEYVAPKTQAINFSPISEHELKVEASDWWPAQIGFRFTNRAAEFQLLEFSVSSTETVEIQNLPVGWVFEQRQVYEGKYYYI